MNPLKICFSPCPNDTFIFDALVHHKMDSQGFSFDMLVTDVEMLNKMAALGEPDIIKISYVHLAAVSHHYIALTSGGAMGYHNGPLLVSMAPIKKTELRNALVAIPGEHTTARHLLRRYFPEITHTRELHFSEIVDSVADGIVDTGLIIHESRFTYRQKGLHEIADLGVLWHKETALPLPLGCIVAKRSLPPQHLKQLNSLIAGSVRFALNEPSQALGFVKKYAASMDDDIMMKHIGLYVNDFSVSAGPEGKKAARLLLKDMGRMTEPLFVDEINERINIEKTA